MATQLAEPSLSADKALSAFLSHLEGERRLSPRTVEAYDRDLSGLFEFLTGHLGGRLTLKALSLTTPARPPKPRVCARCLRALCSTL